MAHSVHTYSTYYHDQTSRGKLRVHDKLPTKNLTVDATSDLATFVTASSIQWWLWLVRSSGVAGGPGASSGEHSAVLRWRWVFSGDVVCIKQQYL